MLGTEASMFPRLLHVDREGPRTGPNGTVIKTPAEKMLSTKGPPSLTNDTTPRTSGS